MAKLYLRGVSKPLTIKKSTAESIGIIYDDATVSGKDSFTFEGIRFRKEDIKHIIENDPEDNQAESSDSKKIANEAYYEEENAKYNKHIASLCDKPVAIKSNDTRLYELVWGAFTSSPVTPFFLDEVKKRQEEFFSTQPKHPYASINILDLLPREKHPEYSIKDLLPSYMSKKVQNIINESFRTAKYLGKI